MSVTPGVGLINESEIIKLIKDSRVGVLTLVDGDKPYAIPVEHYFNGTSLYFLTSVREGQRKINCINNNANACYVIYNSRREKPEMISKGIPCRSVIIEGKISIDSVKEVHKKHVGKVKTRVLRLDVEQIGNWQCISETCDWQQAWFSRYPELIANL